LTGPGVVGEPTRWWSKPDCCPAWKRDTQPAVTNHRSSRPALLDDRKSGFLADAESGSLTILRGIVWDCVRKTRIAPPKTLSDKRPVCHPATVCLNFERGHSLTMPKAAAIGGSKAHPTETACQTGATSQPPSARNPTAYHVAVPAYRRNPRNRKNASEFTPKRSL
jgi:hypothetical protein